MKKVLSLILSVVLIISLLPTGVFSVVASAATTGTTGECSWTLDGTVLTITGNGAMGNYNTSNASPWGTAITEVVIESGVTSIGAYAFFSCTALKSISIPSSVKSIGSNAFFYCKSLPGIVLPEGVTSIGSDAFYNCYKINEVVLPNSLVSIGESAFTLCRLTSITIPQNVSSIGAGAFSYCSALTSIEVDENNSTYYSANNCIIKKSTNALVAGCNSSVIPDGVTSIEDRAFSGCSARVNITIPDSVTRIGGWAFAGSDFTSITLPKSVTYIAYGAFYICDNLTDVYYSGNKIDKVAINIGGGNDKLTAAHWHYAPCENDAHIYDYDCATACKNCDYVRVADTEHTFDNNCDEVCNVCGTHRIVNHMFEQLGENTAQCKICNTSKSFDFIINTDETITLSYEASKEFDFAIENTSIAKIINVSSSVISWGSYYKKVSSAQISPVFIGETKVNVIDSNGVLLTSSTLLVVEGEHQTQLAEVITPATCTDNGTGIYRCKFCNYEEQGVIHALVHVEVIDAYKAPTCTETGLTEGKHCSVCNEVLVAQTVVEALDHTYTHGVCDVCGAEDPSYVAGVTLSGSYTSFGSANDAISIQLFRNSAEEAVYTFTNEDAPANSGSWSIAGVAPGSYTVKVNKKNHFTREYALTVGNETIALDVEVWLIGDVTGDGLVNFSDYSKVLSQSKKPNSQILTDYAFLCGDVTGDGTINFADYSKVLSQAKGKGSLWQ